MPDEVNKRKFLFQTIEDVFRRYGYLPIETAAMENLSTLTGKYGDEGEKLLFKILNNGDYLAKADEKALRDRDSSRLLPTISKRGLRYDLTVPFARYVVMHQNDLQFPFKRFQIQPVWRADRPQKGRYQEFYQCDVDVVGSESLMYEAELVKIYDDVFTALGVEVIIKVNHRRVLMGIARAFGQLEQFNTFAAIIDKLDKIGEDGVKKELGHMGFSDEDCTRLFQCLNCPDISSLLALVDTNEDLDRGVEELRTFYEFFDLLDCNNEVVLDLTLARGLGYYTGCIFEVKAKNVEMGSIGGGGRYSNLTESFGLSNMPGVGISFGAERIFDVMESLGLFKDLHGLYVKIIFLAFDKDSHQYAFRHVSKLRSEGYAADMYPEPAKFKKQMKYASAQGYRYVVIVGSNELSAGKFTLRNMLSGEQHMCDLEEIVEILASK